MFVRLLVMLISNVLCCFSVLVCCRSLVQFVAQRGEIKQSLNLGPYQCDRAQCARAQGGRPSVCLVNCISCIALAGPSLHSFNTCAVGFLRQLHAIDRTVWIERSAVERTAHNWTYTTLRLSSLHYDQMHTGLRSIAPPAIKRTPDLAAHLFLSINRTLCNFIFSYVWKRLEAPSVA